MDDLNSKSNYSMQLPKSNKVTYIGSEGPLQRACEQVFGWQNDVDLIVILWHEGWIWGGSSYWEALRDKLTNVQKEVRILVTFAGETPDADGTPESRRALRALLRALNLDIEAGDREKTSDHGGWCRITNFNRLAHSTVCWLRNEQSFLLQLCKVSAALAKPVTRSGTTGLPRPTLSEFFHFLADPAHFRTKSLHDKPDEAVEGLRSLKWLEAHATFDSRTRINILLVENKPEDLSNTNQDARERLKELIGDDCPTPLGFFPNADFYLIRENFHQITGKDDRKKIKAIKCKADGATDLENATNFVDVPWENIDLVLQDIVLDELTDCSSITGLDLAPHYFEACPQALVFMLTSLDIETLVGSGEVNWKYVDCVVSKKALPTIWYEYRRCFRERFGRMFWPDWSTVDDTDRNLLRGLFGSLRRWQIEPDILWHGQTLPEMIDHAHRHITALWKLANDFIGTLIENGVANAEVLSLRHRVALAVAVWMHDVGHRGDEYVTGSMDIRASHAGISERLLLRNPDAYRLGWLLDSVSMPHKDCRDIEKGMTSRLECRNLTSCSAEAGLPLCLMREIGLLCRHHQSNAPLDNDSLKRMATKGKEPSIYSLVPDGDSEGTMSSEEFLFKISNDALPMPWARGLRVMLLKDFKTAKQDEFRALTGLLRMLDAMQLHRSRVGSSAFIAGFNEFVETKFSWCRSERIRLEDARRAATPGRKSFMEATSKLAELDEYEILLRTQQVHFWRQAAVHEMDVRWSWQPDGTASIDVCYILDEHALDHLADLNTSLPKADGRDVPFNLSEALEGDSPEKKWIENLADEVVGSEHYSQYLNDSVPAGDGYLGALRTSLQFRIYTRLKNKSKYELVFSQPTVP